MSSGPVWSLNSTLVSVELEGGVVGWGETCPLGATYAPAHAEGARAALNVLGPALIGSDAANLRAVQGRMDAALNGHAYAKAALDIAVHDALARTRGLPVFALLGGALTDCVPAYFAISVGPPEEMAREAAERAQEGYQRLQIKVGGRPIAEDIETVRRVWAALNPQVRLVLDANRALNPADAITLSQSLRDIPVAIEQPCDTLAQLAQMRPRLAHPLYMDESATDIATLVRASGPGLVDGFGLKLTRMGGLSGMQAARDICEAAGLRHTCDDSWGGDIIAAACVHMASTVQPALLDGVWLAQPHINGHYDAQRGVRAVDGRISVPNEPGLGVSIDPEQFGPSIATFN